MKKYIHILILAAVIPAGALSAEELTLAVASNFTGAMDGIVEAFEAASGHEVVVSYGSSGRLYAQISNGAPFQIFFSADQEKPAALEAAGLIVPGSRFTYAIGALVLWSADPGVEVEDAAVLRQPSGSRVAIANPRLAPYGQAALDVLENLSLKETLESRLVRGENISQTFQFVDTGNAQTGFVAMSQVMENGKISRGAGWVVPAGLYDPIRQDAVLLKRAGDSPAAEEFMVFIKGDRAKSIINSYGYRTD